MSEESQSTREQPRHEGVDRLESEIEKEISKLRFYLEETGELLESKDYEEMRTVDVRTTKISERLSELIARAQELKIEQQESSRNVRQWKKDIKLSYAPLMEQKTAITKALQGNQQQIKREEERRAADNQNIQRQREEQQQRELREKESEHEEYLRQKRFEQERQLWEERLQAEIRATKKKIELETQATSTQVKLPKLKITPFNGSPTDWIRFENMFTTQIHNKSNLADEEKFGYLLESVDKKVKEKIANLKPSRAGYNTAWERLKKDYGHPSLVINTHLEAIINLPAVKGANYERVKEFYEKICQRYDALQTLGEGTMLKGLVMTMLNKVPNIRSDLVRTDDNWEEWEVTEFIQSLQQWLRRNKVDDQAKGHLSHDSSKKERHWYA